MNVNFPTSFMSPSLRILSMATYTTFMFHIEDLGIRLPVSKSENEGA